MSELVPKLRFGEFSSTSWKELTLSSIAKIERGRFSPRPRNDPQFYGGIIPFAQTNDVSSSNGYVSKYSQTLNEKGLKVSKLFPEGTILMTIAANIGYCGVLSQAMACPDSLVGITCKNGINNYFLNFYLNREQPRIDFLAPRAAQKNINIEFLSPYKLIIPSAEQEQQKIADFLTSVDSKISQLTEKHRLLTQYKKGVMQQIFSQQLCFKDEDGSEFGEWKTIAFGKLFNWVRTNNLSRDKLTYTPTKIQNIHYGDIHMRFPALFDQAKVSIPYVIEDEQEKLVSQADFCKLGDIVIADASEDYADIGKTIEIVSIQNSTLVSGLHTYIARPINEFALGYMGYLFQYSGTRYQIKKLAQGVSVLGISKTNLEKIELPIPNIQEQQKIAQFLQAIDVKIDATSQQLEQTKLFKKGLLQQMFV